MVRLVNRAKMITATTGTGTLTLGTASDGFQSFADAGITDGQTVRYTIEDGSEFEIGTGTYTASGTTLTRSVDESSNADAPLNLTGAATVFVVASSLDIQQPPSEGAFVDGDKTKLDTAVQPGDNISTLTNDAGYTTNIGDITGVTAGGGLTGGGTSGGVTLSHADTSSQGSVNNSGSTVVQDVSLDGFGHITNINSKSLSASDVGALGVNDKAADSNELDGLNSSQFLRSDINNTFTGTLTSSNVGDYTLRIAGANSDTQIIRVDASDGSSNNGNFGFTLSYRGDRTGNDNSFSLFSDNTTDSSQIEAIRVNQNGGTTFASSVSAASFSGDGSGLTSVTSPVKAWVNFRGTSSVTIRDSFNVSSVTDLGTGDYRVNFATALPDNDYAVVSNRSADDNFGATETVKLTDLNSTSVRLLARRINDNSGSEDASTVCAAMFR